jgi:haloacid dehalogenase superfamily, subfamily IA, variant 3 with third motif having DD or ED/haloacid dehalogenase superfamily, subfamily IA, variant 1 with third motif having Dx(3-4)D or Dx(3-4)E
MIKGILIDFGGTIDSDGIHWFNAFSDAYAMVADVPNDLLWDAYVNTERTLGRNPIIKPTDTFCKTLQTKIALQTEYLQSKGITVIAQDTILDTCYNKVVKHISTVSKPALERIKLPMVLVTNFYGNMHTVLQEFALDHLFKDVIESAVAGVRKPDPQIFRLGVAALGLEPRETVMIGDSPDKDILPAQSIGCQIFQITPSSPLSSFPL